MNVGICAGGKSRRMGRDKALLRWGGSTLSELLYSRFSPPYKVIFSFGSATDRAAVYTAEHLPLAAAVYDEYADFGPLEGIRRILGSSEDMHTFICAVDMPFVSCELAEYMEQFISSDYDCICLRAMGEPQPLCAIYSRNAASAAKTLIDEGEHRLSAFVSRLNTKYIDLKYTVFDEKVCINLNTPEEYGKAIFPIVFAVCGYQNSGKTAVICELIKRFYADGLKTAVIKHTCHDHSFGGDRGDTARFAKAGAVYSSIFSDGGFFLNSTAKVSAEDIAGMCGGADVVIIEGMKNAAKYPKILCISPLGGEFPDKVENVIYTVRDFRRECMDISGLYYAVSEHFDIGRMI